MVPWNGLFVGPFGLCPRRGGLGIVLVTPHVFNPYKHGRSLTKFLHTQGGAHRQLVGERSRPEGGHHVHQDEVRGEVLDLHGDGPEPINENS